jgi:hypothetical protein
MKIVSNVINIFICTHINLSSKLFLIYFQKYLEKRKREREFVLYIHTLFTIII